MSAMELSPFDVEVLDRSYGGPAFEVTADKITAYAGATNDRTPLAAAGSVAPPVFSFVPMRPALRAMLIDLTPLYEELKGLHGEQDIFFMSPLEPGMKVTPHGSVVGIRPRPTGTAVVLRLQSRDEEGVLVNEHFTTIYFKGVEGGVDAGIDPPGHRLPAEVSSGEPVARVTSETDLDQPKRYSLASGDTGAYHLDVEAARAIGLPGIIMHGMCTFAMAGSAVLGAVADGDITRLRRLAVRFSHPVIPGEALDTRIWRIDDGGRPGVYGFEVTNPAGVAVVTHGRLEVR